MIRLAVTVSPGRLILDKKLLRATLRGAGNEVASLARSLVRKSAGSGNQYGRHRASAPGQPPASLSGVLARSIKVRVYRSGDGVSIRDTAFYAKMLEAGAHGGGGNTRNRANILQAGEKNRRGRVLRGKNRMKRSAVSKTRLLEPRPFLTTALAMRQASIGVRIVTSVNQGLKFERQKP